MKAKFLPPVGSPLYDLNGTVGEVTFLSDKQVHIPFGEGITIFADRKHAEILEGE